MKTEKIHTYVPRVLNLFCLMLILFAMTLPAGTLKYKGELAFESRLFQNDHLEETRDGNLALFGRIEMSYRSGAFRSGLRLFGRLDTADGERSLIGIEEAWVGFRKSGWDIKLGAQMLNWSAAEAFHPADMINSRILDSDIESREKLGEVMLSVKKKFSGGSVTVFVMPRYESPKFPSPESRLSFLPAGLEVGDAFWLETDGNISDNRYGLQFGARFSKTLGASDMTLHYIQHQDRSQPVVLLDASAGELRPVYFPVRDMGGTFLRVMGAWILKIEYSYRDFINPDEPVDTGFAGVFRLEQPDHHQFAMGLEYGWSFKNGGEGTVIIEGQGLLGVNKETRARLHPFQRDVLIGYRHAWNDVLSRELLITSIFDIERKREFLFNVSYRQRLSDTWGIRLGFRLVDAPVKQALPVGLEALHKSNQVFMTLTRYF
ncbi:MAG: hypothetical protein GY940_09725 [bacterium]|nr:hypothetical protein [bacterium]